MQTRGAVWHLLAQAIGADSVRMHGRVMTLMLVAVLAGCAAVTPSPVESTPASPLAAPSTSANASSTPAAFAPATLGWWRSDAEILSIGRLDGTQTAQIATEPLWRDPLTHTQIVRGPVANLVLYGQTSGQQVEVHLVNALTGDDRVVAALPMTVGDIEVGPSGSQLFWIDIGQSAGVWRLDLGSGRRTRLLPPPETERGASGVVLAAVAIPRAELALSDDGRRVAALWCLPDRCRVQVASLETGEVGPVVPLPNWVNLLGFAREGVSVSAHCVPSPPAPILDGACQTPDARAIATELALSFAAGAELPAGWSFGMQAVPDAPFMSFELDAVAIPDDGGEPIVLEALGTFSGQG